MAGMISCPACSRAAPDDSQFCPACGARIPAGGEAVTLLDRVDPAAPKAGPTPGAVQGAAPGAAPGRSRSAVSSAAWLSSDSGLDGRFAAGTVFAGRYRIIGRIGKGGMGEVYRADDLRLGQPVALKFLPLEVAQSPERLGRFLAEVRIARQVSHPNVCRVYDADESEGLHYLSMEFIDGEDLASLLRRIGRLPRDKALETARQVCAGLSAIHEKQVLHRDLKPANVMLDGRGVARIADFGLAEVTAQDGGASGRAGTPAYMAPEQLAGGEATARSDVYALGLVLYELFTGKPAITGETLDKLIVAQLRTPPRPPSELVTDIDPAVETVLLRCLEKDPLKRPASALAVSMALPGGDPLAAALLAGETPSPELVAAAGAEGSLRPGVAAALLALLGASIATLMATAPATRLLDLARVEKSPQVLQDRAQSILRDLGYSERPADSAWGMNSNRTYLPWVRRTDSSADRWDSLRSHRPAPVLFWYRQSPEALDAANPLGQVYYHDPQHTVPGSVKLVLDPDGRLLELSAVPPVRTDSTRLRTSPPWERAFAAAGLAMAKFEPTSPALTPPTHCDTTAAWKGSFPGRPDLPLRIELGAYQGRIQSLRLVEPWDAQLGQGPPRESMTSRIGEVLTTGLIVLSMISAALLARRNLRRGLGDRRGAARVAWAVFALFLLRVQLMTHHTREFSSEWMRFQVACGVALFVGGFLYVLYLGLEPYIRKLSPQTLIAWTRLLSGRGNDPRVGRDVLVGLSVGAAVSLLAPLFWVIVRSVGKAPPLPLDFDTNTVVGLRGAASSLALAAINATWVPLAVLLLILGLRQVVRRAWLARGIGAVVFIAIGALGQPSVAEAIGGGLQMFVLLVLLLRLGVLAVMAYFLASQVFTVFPITASMGAWYAPSATLGLAAVVALAVYAFRIASAGHGRVGDPTPSR